MNTKDEAFALYLGPEQECSYLPERRARSIFFDPTVPLSPMKAQWLTEHGFRRSGEHMYRPHCEGCTACIPLRVPVDAFRPDRSQRRCWKKNRPSIEITATPARFCEEQFDLYQRYTRARHPGGSMDGVTRETYMGFLASSWSATEFLELRQQDRLVAVAVTDTMENGLSAVYTFFAPELAARSLGVYAVLWQIELARARGLPWLYLGYWVPGCRKMEYKDRFRPVEAWLGSTWRRFEPGIPIRWRADGGQAPS